MSDTTTWYAAGYLCVALLFFVGYARNPDARPEGMHMMGAAIVSVLWCLTVVVFVLHSFGRAMWRSGNGG